VIDLGPFNSAQSIKRTISLIFLAKGESMIEIAISELDSKPGIAALPGWAFPMGNLDFPGGFLHSGGSK